MPSPTQPQSSPPLTLRLVPWDAVQALVEGRRLADWAEDFPDDGDLVIARLLHRTGPPPIDHDQLWGHYQVIETATGLVVGGVGLFGAPRHGQTEIGYGIVPSRQGRGYATEAVATLVSLAFAHADVAIVANPDPGNLASRRVLEKAGFQLLATSHGEHFRITRPNAT
jgi:RimJ/RimL family protein N-acetyltransferase